MRPLDPRLLRHARTARRFIAAVSALGVLTAALVIVQAQLLATGIVGAFQHGDTIRALRPVLVALAAVVAGRVVVAWATEAASYHASAAVKAELRRRLLTRAAQLGPRWLAGQRNAELTALATDGIEALDGYFAKYLPQLVLASRRAGRGPGPGRGGRPARRADDRRDPAAHPALRRAGREGHRRVRAAALARAGGALAPFPRRGVRAADAQGVRAGQGAAGGHRRGHRRLPARHHGHAAGRVPFLPGARARRDPVGRAGGGRGRSQPGLRPPRPAHRADRADPRPGGLPAAAPGRRPVPRERRRPGRRRRSHRRHRDRGSRGDPAPGRRTGPGHGAADHPGRGRQRLPSRPAAARTGPGVAPRPGGRDHRDHRTERSRASPR